MEAGADILELGVPFSDPMADGPVIQRSGERALKHGVGLAHVLHGAEFRKADDSATPIVLMGYANPIEAMGIERFAAAAKAAGVDGVIVVDYPPEECVEFCALDEARTASIRSSSSRRPRPKKRIERWRGSGSGYLYYVSLRGVTGAANIDFSEVAAQHPADPRGHASCRSASASASATRESARRVAQSADAVVIGSRIIQEIEAGSARRRPWRA